MGLLQPLRSVVLLVSIFLGIIAAADVQSSACDDGWILYNDMCYLTRDDYEQFGHALSICRLFGGEMAYAKDQKTLDFLSKQANKRSAYGRWYGAKADYNEKARIYDPATEYFVQPKVKIPMPKVHKFSSPSTSCVGLLHDGTQYEYSMKDRLVDVLCDTQLPYICRGESQRAKELMPDKKKNDSQWVVDDDDIFWFSSRSDRRTYTDAVDACNTKTMTLISIRGSVQLKKITKELERRQDYHIDPWWTGLQVKNGVFSWSNSRSMDLSIVKWDQQLRRNRHSHMSCRLLLRDGTADERSCYRGKAPFMCMRPHRLNGKFGCPHKWIRAGKSCYMAATSVNTGMVPYTDIDRLCSKAGSHIVSVNSKSEKIWLLQSTFFRQYAIEYWTSLNDMKESGVFTWADGSSPKGNIVTWQGSLMSYSGDCFYFVPKTRVLSKTECRYTFLPGCQYPSSGTCVSSKWKYYKGQCYFDLNIPKSWTYYRSKDTMLFDCYADTVKYDNSLVVYPLKVNSKDIMDMYTKMVGSRSVWTGLKESKKGVYTWADGTEADLSIFNTNGYIGTDNSTSKCAVMRRSGYFEPKSCTTCYCGYGICEKDLGTGNGVASPTTDLTLVVSTVFTMLVLYRRFVF